MLRQRVVRTPLRVANPVWMDDPHFDIARHVKRVQTDGPVGREELREIVGRLMCQCLDREHPLWRLDVVEQLEDDTMALVWRIHHAMADGTACMRLGSAVLWSSDPDQPDPLPVPWSPAPTPSAVGLFASGLRDRTLRRHDGPRPRRHDSPLHESREVLERELSPTAAITPLAHRIGPARAVAFAATSLEDCKHAAKSIDPAITVNDVVLSLIAGGVRAWLNEGQHHAAGGIRVKVPVSLHSTDEGGLVANRDSYFFVDLPVSEPDPVKRLLAINRETDVCKLHHDAETLYRLGQHPFVARWAMRPRVFTFNVSNVRGPGTDIHVLGARVRELYPVAEVAQRHALRVAVISAAGSLFFGFCADREAVPGLQLLADGVSRARDELLALAR
jgi:WS/DGAT/MGAT family acyltransferase